MKRKTRGIGPEQQTVSPICLGTMLFGAPIEPRDAIAITHWAIDHEINFIDTANMYEGYTRSAGSPGGVSESILGKALQGRRDRVVLATKVGMKVGPEPEDEFTSPGAIRKHLDKSLQRLQTDYLDVYYLHKPDPATPMVDTLSALSEVRKAGKIRHYGVSNYSVDQLRALLQTADENNLPRPAIVQPPYSLLNREIEKDLLPLCEQENIPIAPYEVLQAGLLTGKYRRGEPLPPDSRKKEADDWVWELTGEVFERIEQIEAEAASKNRSLLAHAILSILEKPAVISVILGVKRVEQLRALIEIVDTLE